MVRRYLGGLVVALLLASASARLHAQVYCCSCKGLTPDDPGWWFYWCWLYAALADLGQALFAVPPYIVR